MTIGERICALRLRAQQLREELRKTENSLRECESSCTHKNTTERTLVFIASTELIRYAVTECNGCGVRIFKEPPKKRYKKKV